MSARLLAIVLLAAPFVSCRGREAARTPPAPLVKLVELTSRPGEPLELRGSVTSRSRIRLGFKLPGVLAEMAVKDGERVRKGQLLARLDDVDARSQWRMAVARRDKARRDAERATRLSQEGAMATSARDDAVSQLEAADAQVAQAEDALARTRLLAPAGGTVFARLAEPGEAVGAGLPVLVLDTTAAVVVKSAATERELRTLRLGQHVTLAAEDRESGLAGRVTSLATTPSAADGLYAVEVTPLVSQPLRPGTLVRMTFEAAGRDPRLRIPLEALVHRQDRDFVFLIEGGTRVRQVPIEVDEAEGREVVVRSGLTGGEKIVAEGAYFLENGQSVRTFE